MNDPGLDAPIAKHAKAVEQVDGGGEEDEAIDDEDEAFREPSRWWFTSTAFPLLAGTFGPIASAFNICALVEHWRVSIPPGGTEAHGDDVADPVWLIAINAVSLALALIANLALLSNMARRLPFRIAQPITIVGWYISSFLLIGLIVAATYGMEVPAGQERALTQAFYYAIMAAGLYVIVSTLMVVTVYGAYKDHYKMEFQLTTSQRTLMLQTIAYLFYLECGAAIFTHIEDWSFVDAVYWANYTMLTIGTGDYKLSTHVAKSLLFFYAIGGIVILGLVIGSIRSLILERGKMKLGARMVEKRRAKVVGRIMDTTTPQAEKGRMTPLAESHSSLAAAPAAAGGKSEHERREDEFHLMRKIQDHASRRRKWISLSISASAWLFLWLVGAMVFYIAERNHQDWSYFDGLYFTYVSLLTIGYGDFYPQSNAGKAFFVFWSLLAIPTLTVLISNMGDTVIKTIRDLTLKLGEITVLPDENSVRGRIKEAGKQVARRGGRGSDEVERPAGLLGESIRPAADADPEGQGRGHDSSVADRVDDRLAEALEQDELDEVEIGRTGGDDWGGEGGHLYHYLLVKEIRRVMGDLAMTPPRRYTYQEWAWFLRLLGEAEGGRGGDRGGVVDREGDGDGDGDKDGRQWSWVGPRSPLMGETEEAEWVLERLAGRLEGELERVKDGRRRRRGMGMGIRNEKEKGMGRRGEK